MAVITAVVTDAARAKWPKALVEVSPETDIQNSVLSYFRVGMGGWQNPGPVRRTPDATLVDIDIRVDKVVGGGRPGNGYGAARYASITQPTYYFQKAFTPADFLFVGPTTIQLTCLLDTNEYNNDGAGGSPVIWEIGIFDVNNVMVAYGTFPSETKDVTKKLQYQFRLVF